ncbi:unnamed protein product [Ectocarpus sp. CCAP 1310/34]|nr:unnamed protein product [Ectocarpus sp. CCAP 1310/34]
MCVRSIGRPVDFVCIVVLVFAFLFLVVGAHASLLGRQQQQLVGRKKLAVVMKREVV